LLKKATGPVHKHYGPTKGFVRGYILVNPYIDLIAFDDELQIGVKQGIEQQSLFHCRKTTFPIQKRIFGQIKGSACRIQSQPLGSGLEDSHYEAHRFPDPRYESVGRRRKEPFTVGAAVNIFATVVFSLINSVSFNYLTLARGTGYREKSHEEIPLI
jgi:hypothetical protein